MGETSSRCGVNCDRMSELVMISAIILEERKGREGRGGTDGRTDGRKECRNEGKGKEYYERKREGMGRTDGRTDGRTEGMKE